MNKKVLAILAASATALGSAMIATPVRAQTAILPVEVEVTPRIFLRTYSELKFVVNQQDLTTVSSVEQAESYNEKTGITPLSTDVPEGEEKNIITKEIPVLYQVWGGGVTDNNIEIEASGAELTGGNTFASNQTVTMSVQKGSLKDAQVGNSNFKEGSATLTFDFTNAGNDSIDDPITYSGGEITIKVTNP